MIIDEPPQQPTYDWMSPIMVYLDNQPPSDDNTEVKRIACKCRMYHLIDRVLFQQGANGMMMKCISREEGIELLEDGHKGVCGSHSSSRSIIGKAFKHEFYWPTMKNDAMEVVKKCRDCQFFRKHTIKHADPLGLLMSLALSQSGESISWASCPGLQVVSDICSSELTCSLNGWKSCQQ
jgi:hypothetical protein